MSDIRAIFFGANTSKIRAITAVSVIFSYCLTFRGRSAIIKLIENKFLEELMKRVISLIICAVMIVAIISGACISAQGLEYGEPLRYCEDVATGKLKKVYDALKTAFSSAETPEKIDFEASWGLSSDDVLGGVNLFVGDYPEYFWINTATGWGEYSYGSTVVGIAFNYDFTGNALLTARNALEDAVEDIIDAMPSSATSNFDKTLYLHDALASRVTYVEAGRHQTAYGALVDGTAVCAGYAAAYQLLCHAVGIDCTKIVGESINPSTGVSVPHAWNLVWLDSNTCVYTDVTWDDSPLTTYHEYFNLGKSEIATGHTHYSYFTLPACNHDNLSYHDVKGTPTITDSTSAAAAAAMFDTSVFGVRSLTALYTGSDPSAWLDNNISDILKNLTYYSLISYPTMTGVGKEIRITFTVKEGVILSGDHVLFCTEPDATVGYQGPHPREIQKGAAFTMYAKPAQGYYFPENYSAPAVGGISVTYIDSMTLKISGIPTTSARITLPAPMEQAGLSTLNVVFTANGYDSGILSGFGANTIYSLDGGNNWAYVPNNGRINGIDPAKDIMLVNIDGHNYPTSHVQTIDVTRASAPTGLVANLPATPGGRGTVNTNATHEYSSSSGSIWTACSGATELLPGNYKIRVRASGTTLASAYVSLTVPAYTADTYIISISGENIDLEGCSQIRIAKGATIDLMVIADDGYYFPENYATDPVNGLTVTRLNNRQIRISGTPTASTALFLTPATVMTAETTPSALFTADGADSGVLEGLSEGMKYSVDGGENWIEATSESVRLTDVSESKDIKVMMPGDGVTTFDSEAQIINVTRAEKPSLTVTAPTAEGGKGSINTDSRHEYSKDLSKWISCEGVTELEAGAYYVRVKANGSALASDKQIISIPEFVSSSTDEDNANKETEKQTEVATEAVTEKPAESETEAITEDNNVETKPSGGCGAAVSGAAVAVMIVALGSVVAVKRKEN